MNARPAGYGTKEWHYAMERSFAAAAEHIKNRLKNHEGREMDHAADIDVGNRIEAMLVRYVRQYITEQ